MKAHLLMMSAARTRAAKAAGETEGDEGERDVVVHADTRESLPRAQRGWWGLFKRGRKCSTDKGRPP